MVGGFCFLPLYCIIHVFLSTFQSNQYTRRHATIMEQITIISNRGKILLYSLSFLFKFFMKSTVGTPLMGGQLGKNKIKFCFC